MYGNPRSSYFRPALRLVLGAWMAVLLCSAARAAEPVDIQMHGKATVTGPVVFLHHIADIGGADPETLRKFADLRIDDAPLPGHTLLVHKSTVLNRLRRFGVDEARYRLSAAGPVQVTRQHTEVDPETIRESVRDYIMGHAPWNKEQLRVRNIRCNQPVLVPPGPMKLNIEAPKHTDWIGAIPFRVDVLVGGQTIRKLTVAANIEVWSDVVLAAKPLGKFQPIGPDAIRIERMNLARVPNDAILKADRVVGRRTTSNIAANTILRDDQIEMPPVVRRGDVVAMVAETPMLKIAAKGIVKENGGIGERIRVVNLASKKTIYALVVDGQTVKVEF